MNPGTPIAFDTNNLQTTNILTGVIDHESPAEPDLKVYALSHANDNAIPYISFPQKPVHIEGTLVAYGLSTTFDAFLHTFRSYFNGIQKNLDIGYNGTTLRYIATPGKPVITRPGGLNFAKFQIDFVCKPFGMDIASTTILNATGRTASAYTDSLTFGGSAPYQKPIITYTLTAVTGGTNQPITFSNNSNGQAITVQRTWTAGDVVVIDSTKKTVTVNGILVDFSGAFLEFTGLSNGAPTVGSMSYTDGFTTRTFSINIIYNALYK